MRLNHRKVKGVDDLKRMAGSRGELETAKPYEPNRD